MTSIDNAVFEAGAYVFCNEHRFLMRSVIIFTIGLRKAMSLSNGKMKWRDIFRAINKSRVYLLKILSAHKILGHIERISLKTTGLRCRGLYIAYQTSSQYPRVA